MKKSWNALLVLLLALPAYGQDQPAPAPADQPAADSPPPADALPADAPPADNGAVMNSISADSQAETPPADANAETVATIPVEEVAAEPSAPWRLYAGVDWVRDTVSASSLKGFKADDYDTGMYRVRFGARVFDAIGVEAHYGIDRSQDSKAGSLTAKTKQYYGLFLVPRATLFETVDLTFPVGYAKTKLERPGGGADLSSVSYGINAELPIRVFSASLPDLRLEGGGMVYYQKTNARVYGFNAGLRYDFEVNGTHMGNPFSGVGDKVGGFFKSLWPFGKDEAAEAKPAQ